MVTNQAAWLAEKEGKPLKVDRADMPTPSDDEVIVRTAYTAINPIDWKMQDHGFYIKDYPTIVGGDAAGEIHEVGSNVKGFKKGDRVMAHCQVLITQQSKHGSFQNFVAVRQSAVAHIPSTMSFADACVLPLVTSTAAAGLYQPDVLALPYPTIPAKPSGKVIVVWGGSSSVGSTVLQLCRASGVETIATASEHNHGFCQSLGASQVVDYKRPTVVDDLVKAVKATGKQFAGVYDCISLEDSIKASSEIIGKLGASKRLALVLPGTEQQASTGIEATSILSVAVFNEHPQIGEAVWGNYVPHALKDGSFKPLPPPLVIGKGLESVQKGMDKNKEGVSAKKVVVEL